MLYNGPTGGGPNDSFVGKNVAAGKQGSRVPPKAIEAPQRELVNIIVEGELTPTNDDYAQALKSIRSGKLWSFLDVSDTANFLRVAVNTPHTQLKKHLAFRIWPKNDNTGQCTIQIDAIAAVPLTRRDGSALQAKDIQKDIPFDCVYDGQMFRLASFAQGEVSRIVSNPVLWVRTDGNDANKGGGNNAAQAFGTISAALAYGVNYLAYTGTLLTVALGNQGVYAAPATQSIAGAAATLLGGAGTIQILGDPLNQDAYVIQGTGLPGNAGIIHNAFGTNLTLKGVNIQNNSANYDSLRCSTNGTAYIENVTFSGINGTAGNHLCASDGGLIKVGPGCKVQSSRGTMLYGNGGGITIQGTATITLVGSLVFNVFAAADANGRIFANGGFAGGSVTGKRYQVQWSGFINTNGGGANYFPGNVAGTSATSDQYA